MERSVKQFVSMLVKIFNKHRASGQLNLKHHLLDKDHILEGIQKLETLSSLKSSAYSHLNVHTKEAETITLQRGQIRMMKTENVMQRIYQSALSYIKEKTDRNGRRKDDKVATFVRRRAHFACDVHTIITIEKEKSAGTLYLVVCFLILSIIYTFTFFKKHIVKQVAVYRFVNFW